MICPNMKRQKPKEKPADKMDDEAGDTDDYRELYDEIREEIYIIVRRFGSMLLRSSKVWLATP